MLRFLIVIGLCGSALADAPGRMFVSLGSIVTGTNGIYLSETFKPALPWNELIASWNFRDGNAGIVIDAQVIYPDHQTKWYCLGKWALDSSKHPRESVKTQRDEDGTVATDTLQMMRPGGAVRVRVTSTTPNASITFLGLSFADSNAPHNPLPPNTNVWGKVLTVEERTQADYPEGINEWCSPTATSMLLSFWSQKLARPELTHTVPDTARAVNDPNWPGTGNWPFNTAFAGAHRGMRAYVARFSDVSEMEDWIQAGIPFAFSVSYSLLKGSNERGNGHLVVCIGFNENGDVIVNDPGRRQVRQVYSRANLIKAWAESENTVYLIYPEGATVPRDRFGHWATD